MFDQQDHQEINYWWAFEVKNWVKVFWNWLDYIANQWKFVIITFDSFSFDFKECAKWSCLFIMINKKSQIVYLLKLSKKFSDSYFSIILLNQYIYYNNLFIQQY